MSLKPPKKSDESRPWMTKRVDRVRKIRPEYHLIITEGEKTEPLYFDRIKEIINQQYKERIQLEVEGTGENTIHLFNTAKKHVKNAPNGISHVWVVYDTDDFKAEDINLVQTKCEEESSEDCTYHAIWSNQCVELWYLLHFGYYHSDINRRAYFPKLSEHLQKIGAGQYKKNRKDMYDVLRPKLEDAIKNAKSLDTENSGKTPASSAPGTKVFELIEILKPYL